MRLTFQERKAMIGKSYQSDMNNPDEMKTTVLAVRPEGGGFTVTYVRQGMIPTYLALSKFLRKFPHELKP